MKVNIEIDCTPEEARRLAGFPDLTPLHDKYLATMGEMLDVKAHPELTEAMIRAWAPMGEAGMTFWRRMLDGVSGAAD